MRIIGGEARGRRLRSPAGAAVRPTADRVREALFNSLYSLGDPVPGGSVVDLFAGSGALGLEALSRGATRAVFVESDRRVRTALASNIDALGYGSRATIVAADACDWLAERPRELAGRADVGFADPPYAFAGWDRVLAWPWAQLVVVESDRQVAFDPLVWGLAKEHRYGATVVQILLALSE